MLMASEIFSCKAKCYLLVLFNVIRTKTGEILRDSACSTIDKVLVNDLKVIVHSGDRIPTNQGR